MRRVHLADGAKPDSTLCGIPWEAWQQELPSNDEVSITDLPYGARALVRQTDMLTRIERSAGRVALCPACAKRVRQGLT